MSSSISLFTSTLASSLRGWQGIQAVPKKEKPLATLIVYDIENCPYCRLVREVFTELDLDVEVRPCPKQGATFREELLQRAGKAQFPYLVDPNTGAEMYESMDIIAYLYQTYGAGAVPLRWRLGTLQKLSSSLASAARLGQGMSATPARTASMPLELFSFEGSPFARPVRELLCQLEIAYIVRNCGRSAPQDWMPPRLRERLNIEAQSTLPNRVTLQEKEGRTAIPYLYDPNSGTGLFESDEICHYLQSQYAL
jgi:glutathione S-transferase